MATRSTIALEFADGTIGQVYCHWDGYLSGAGKTLLNSYSDPFKVRELIDLGGVSTLNKDIGVQHPFDNPGRYGGECAVYEAFEAKYGDMTTFYGRDRGEEDMQAHYFKDFGDYRVNHQEEEFEYILRTDGNWYVKQEATGYTLLTEAMVAELAIA
jgi:hypothetical protein